MNRPAKILSFDALRDFQAQLSDFGIKAEAALCSADIEIRRTVDWVHDQLRFWQKTAEKCQEDVNRARSELMHAKSWGPGRGPGTTEQEIALAKAMQRLRHAEEKIVVTKRWIRQLPEILKRYEGPSRQLAGMVAADLKQAVALLQRKIEALQAYAETVAPPLKEGV